MSFPDPLIDTYTPPTPKVFPLADSSHASSSPLHAIIVSLFSSRRTGSVTTVWPYVTLWTHREHKPGSIGFPTKVPTFFYGLYVIHKSHVTVTLPFATQSTHVKVSCQKEGESQQTLASNVMRHDFNILLLD